MRIIGRTRTPIFVDKELKVDIEFSIVVDTLVELTLPICEAIEDDEELNRAWSFKKQKYIEEG